MKELKIVKQDIQLKGILYKIKHEKQFVEILFTFHAIERIKKWKLEVQMVIETLLFPEEVLIGHNKRFIAHRRYGDHIVRAIYEYEDDVPVVITVYFPYKDRYFQGGNTYEDKILKG